MAKPINLDHPAIISRFQPQSLHFKHKKKERKKKSERKSVRKSGKISATSQTWHSGQMRLTKSTKTAIFLIKTNPHSTPNVKQIKPYTLTQDNNEMEKRQQRNEHEMPRVKQKENLF